MTCIVRAHCDANFNYTNVLFYSGFPPRWNVPHRQRRAARCCRLRPCERPQPQCSSVRSNTTYRPAYLDPQHYYRRSFVPLRGYGKPKPQISIHFDNDYIHYSFSMTAVCSSLAATLILAVSRYSPRRLVSKSTSRRTSPRAEPSRTLPSRRPIGCTADSTTSPSSSSTATPPRCASPCLPVRLHPTPALDRHELTALRSDIVDARERDGCAHPVPRVHLQR